MVPDLWRCGGNPVLDIGGLLLHPLGLLALLGIWGLLQAFGRLQSAALVRRLLVTLAQQSLGLAAFLLFVTFIIAVFGEDPSWVIEIAQYIAMAGAWVTVFVYVRREWDATSEPEPTVTTARLLPTLAELFRVVVSLVTRFTLEVIVVTVATVVGFVAGGFLLGVGGALQFGTSAFVVSIMVLISFRRRSKEPVTLDDVMVAQEAARAAEKRRLRGGMDIPRRPVAVTLVALAGIFFFSTGPWFGHLSLLSVFRLPRYVFEMTTTSLASNECLAVRAVELPPPPLILPHEPEVERNPYENGPDYAFPDAASAAYGVLKRRGPSTMPAITRALERVLRRADPKEEAKALVFLKLIGRWTSGSHPILDAWASAPHRPPGQELVKSWQVCVRKKRYYAIGYDMKVDAQCNPLKK